MSQVARTLSLPKRSTRVAFDPRLRVAMLLAFSIACTGCVGWAPALDQSIAEAFAWRLSPPVEFGERTEWTPSGPGAVFATPDEAAIDALVYCYLASREEVGAMRRARGGAVRPTDGGFTYDEPVAAKVGILAKLRYRMRSTDVAHFRHQPSASSAPLGRRALRREARKTVGQQDHAHRPLFVLTPGRNVEVVKGASADHQILARVEPLQQRGTKDLVLRMARAPVLPTAEPLALQPAPEGPPPR